MKVNKELIFKIGISTIVLACVFILGIYIGFSEVPTVNKIVNLNNTASAQTTTTDFDPFWKAWNILKDKSINNKSVNDQEKVWGAIEGLASSYNDPYTVFFPPDENKLFNDTIRGSFGGIGAEIGIKNKALTVVSPLKDSPSQKAGIKSGDVILKIDTVDIKDMSIDNAISLIRGEKGTKVNLTVFRQGEKKTREFNITRDIVEIPTIDTEKRVADETFVIKFYSFSENSNNLFDKALQEFKDSNYNKLILDLRGNPGGYLDVAIDIASNFIEEGKIIAIEDFGDSQKKVTYRSYGPKLFTDRLKFVVLVDGGSASASEILAGALKEHKVATIIGEKTFGKGSVQELIKVTDTTSLKVTVAKWLTPNGTSISDHGLDPDIKVEYTEKDLENKIDPQLNKALSVLKNMN